MAVDYWLMNICYDLNLLDANVIHVITLDSVLMELGYDALNSMFSHATFYSKKLQLSVGYFHKI